MCIALRVSLDGIAGVPIFMVLLPALDPIVGICGLGEIGVGEVAGEFGGCFLSLFRFSSGVRVAWVLAWVDVPEPSAAYKYAELTCTCLGIGGVGGADGTWG